MPATSPTADVPRTEDGPAAGTRPSWPRRGRRGDRRQGLAFAIPALLLIACFLVLPALWTSVPRADRLPAHRGPGRPPAVRRPGQLHAGAQGPGVPRLALAVRCSSSSARRSSGRTSSASGWPGRCGRRAAGVKPSSRRSCCWPGSCRASSWRGCGSRSSTGRGRHPATRSWARRGRDWLFDHPMAVADRLQHLAGHGVLDDAVLGGAARRAALQLESARLAGASGLAAAARRRVPAHPRPHPDQHAADQPVDLQRLLAVPAHQGRAAPRVRGAAGLHLPTALPGEPARLRRRHLAHHAADQPAARAALHPAAARASTRRSRLPRRRPGRRTRRELGAVAGRTAA